MKFFIAIISLLFGIMIGAGITTFLVVKKNQTVRNYLCADVVVSAEKERGVSFLLNSALIEKLKNDSTFKIDEKKAEDLKASGSDVAIGPGGCKNEDDCLAHCSKLENLQECLTFAKKYLQTSEVKK
ncbi:MAG: hypothetical protein V1655_02305 [bacterium]